MNYGIVTIATAIALAATPAAALTINLRGNVTNADAARGFRAAANYWESVITNDVTVNIDIAFDVLPPNVLGSTGSSYDAQLWTDVRSALVGGGSGSLDAIVAANLPNHRSGGLRMLTPGYRTAQAGPGNGINNERVIYDNNTTGNNIALAFTTANGKALGFTYNPLGSDAEVNFSSEFAFDFDPRNGISSGTLDFIGVAVHEFGHALGFVSGVDDYDFLGTGGPVATFDCFGAPGLQECQNLPAQDYAWGSVLDVFRYSDDPANRVAGDAAVMDWTTGTDSFFTIDRGATALADFSTGSFNGDGFQASHWKQNGTCVGFIGVMNPYLCGARNSIVSGLDLAAFDAIGWNLNIDVLANQGYAFDTRQIAFLAGIPEPTNWAMLIAGFGLVGATLRRRRAVVA